MRSHWGNQNLQIRQLPSCGLNQPEEDIPDYCIPLSKGFPSTGIPEIAQVKPCFFKTGQFLESISSTLLQPTAWPADRFLPHSSDWQSTDTTDWLILPLDTPRFTASWPAACPEETGRLDATAPAVNPSNRLRLFIYLIYSSKRFLLSFLFLQCLFGLRQVHSSGISKSYD